MKKFALFSLLPCAVFISGCTSYEGFFHNSNTTPYSQYSYQNANVDTVMNSGRVPPYDKDHSKPAPRKYHVTSEDQSDYNDLNNRIQRNKDKAIYQQKYQPDTFHPPTNGYDTTSIQQSVNTSAAVNQVTIPTAPSTSTANQIKQSATQTIAPNPTLPLATSPAGVPPPSPTVPMPQSLSQPAVR